MLPSAAKADLSDIEGAIEQAFAEGIIGLRGDELGTVTFPFAYLPPLGDSVHVHITFLGFSLCNPPDPWASPNPTPTPPLNIYGCRNSADVVATVDPTVTSAMLTIQPAECFFDLSYDRDEVEFCLECGWLDPCGTVFGEGHILTSASISSILSLTRVGSCLQASIVPGSVSALFSPTGRAFRKTPSLSEDACMTGAWDLLSASVIDQLNLGAGPAFESMLITLLPAVNTRLCELTPAEPSTWGKIKALFD